MSNELLEDIQARIIDWNDGELPKSEEQILEYLATSCPYELSDSEIMMVISHLSTKIKR